MGIGILPIGQTIRLAIITKVSPAFVECEFYDKFGEKSFKCPIPHPYAGRGGGILVGVERDTLVLVANAPQEQWFIVGIIPDINFFADVDGLQDIRSNETPYPDLSEGEVLLKGNPGQTISLLENGNISLDAGIGSKSYDFELSKFAQGLFVRVDNEYHFTEAGRKIEGLIRRDLNEAENFIDTNTTDFLAGESYDKMLTGIGRSPKSEVNDRTTTLFRSTIRNPALVEKREITYEFGDSFNVRGFEREKDATQSSIKSGTTDEIQKSVDLLRADPSIRENRRTDVLDLNLRNYNHLIEKVEGTLVDIYGNIVDINRSPINIPELNTAVDPPGFKRLYDYLRRSVKYHFEINSRKDLNDTDPPNPILGISEDNLKLHSRFSIDIDSEGLTKINIPATSETGNIPILSRHLVSREIQDSTVDNGAFKDPSNIDITNWQFGSKKISGDGYGFAGQTIMDQGYLPRSTNNLPITVGTAFHDMFNIASSIFKNGKLKNSNLDGTGSAILPLNQEINNKIPGIDSTTTDAKPNAGGRSAQLNFDGSLEASIGSDTVDRKSLVLDLAGGIVSHVGSDQNGRSLIQQFDGYVIIQMGGTSIKDERFENSEVDRPGRMEIHYVRPNASPHKIVIDEDGITIISAGRMLFRSEGDFVISAGSNLLIDAENIKQFGAFDELTRSATGSEVLIGRSGRKK